MSEDKFQEKKNLFWQEVLLFWNKHLCRTSQLIHRVRRLQQERQMRTKNRTLCKLSWYERCVHLKEHPPTGKHLSCERWSRSYQFDSSFISRNELFWNWYHINQTVRFSMFERHVEPFCGAAGHHVLINAGITRICICIKWSSKWIKRIRRTI